MHTAICTKVDTVLFLHIFYPLMEKIAVNSYSMIKFVLVEIVVDILKRLLWGNIKKFLNQLLKFLIRGDNFIHPIPGLIFTSLPQYTEKEEL